MSALSHVKCTTRVVLIFVINFFNCSIGVVISLCVNVPLNRAIAFSIYIVLHEPAKLSLNL